MLAQLCRPFFASSDFFRTSRGSTLIEVITRILPLKSENGKVFLGHGSAAAPVFPTHGLCGEVEAEVQEVFRWYTHLREEFASESFLMSVENNGSCVLLLWNRRFPGRFVLHLSDSMKWALLPYVAITIMRK